MEIEDEIDRQKMRQEIHTFLYDSKNQHDYNYTMMGGTIKVNEKKHTILTSIRLHVTSIEFLYEIVGLVLIIGGISYAFFSRKLESQAEEIYYELKNKIISEKILNISHEMRDLETKYGNISEGLWARVDALRSKEKKIGYYTEDFIYWKLL